MSEDITSNAIPSYPAEAPRRAPRFDVEPYQPDGVAPPGGLAFLMVGVLGTAAALGLVLSYAVEQFYLILVFPLLAGALLGGAGRALVRAGRVRSPAVAATVAALGGVAMMFFMHYFDYLHNLNNPGWQGAPAANVLEYIDIEAQEGVVVGENGNNDINLGYVGSYLYFAFETILAAGVAAGIAGVCPRSVLPELQRLEDRAHAGRAAARAAARGGGSRRGRRPARLAGNRRADGQGS